MKKALFRLCSVILVAVMVINMLPMGVFAEEFRESLGQTTSVEPETEPTTQAQTQPTGQEETEAYIIDEITDKRTEFSKEFLLSDGTHMAAVYGDAVHYETNEGWAEIDNTLVAATDGTLSNTAGVWDVRFPQQLSKDQSITIEKDGHTLSFFLAGELTKPETAEMPLLPTLPVVKNEAAALGDTSIPSPSDSVAQITVDGKQETFFLAHMQQATASIQALDTMESSGDGEITASMPDKNRSRLQYADVYQNTDVVYDLESNKVKESVVLASYRDTLRGYRYSLDVGDMLPVLEENGSITLYDQGKENPVLVMPAPYLVDNAGAYNDDIQVQLTGTGNRYTMTYLLPQQWLAAEDRAWPVVLDPVIYGNADINNILDRTVSSKNSTTGGISWSYNSCGYSTNSGIERFYIKYNSLPHLSPSDVVINAEIKMKKLYNTGTSATIEVHKVESAWDSSSVSWSNQPLSDDDIADYAIVQAAGDYTWTITDLVRDWYANNNYGMMFKTSDSIENGSAENYKQFYSSDNNAAYRPTLEIQFRNNNGLEGYWDYTPSSAGNAGTGYVNNYTGNLVWIHEDIGYGGNRMPVSIQHVYNMNDVENNDFAMGNGWRTNYHQRVYSWTQNGKLYYVWEDDDGTKHYFTYDSTDGAYKDEDGLELTLRVENTSYGSYSLTDKKGNVRYFDGNGRLSSIYNNQETKSFIKVDYFAGDTTSSISTIRDGAGRKYYFEYTSGKVSRIRYTGTGTAEISSVSFTYNTTGIYCRMTQITKPEGVTAKFGYDSTAYIMSVTDTNNYKITYDYNTISQDYQPYRIIGVNEYAGSTPGGSLDFEYSHNRTKITDYNGNVEIMQFNDLGNTVCIQDDEGRAQFTQFSKNSSDDAGKSNQMTLSSKLQNTVSNLISDNSFEIANRWTSQSGATASLSTEHAYMGSTSLKITSTQAQRGVYSQSFQVPPWEVVTFSAYVKAGTSYRLMIQRDAGGGNYINHYGETISANSEWTRQEVSYKNASGLTVTMWAFLQPNTSGTVYMDCVQVEIAPTASRFNVLENGDFTFTDSKNPAYYWVPYDLTSTEKRVSTIDIAAPMLSRDILTVTGDPSTPKRLVNYIPISGSAGDCYVFSGWAWADSAVPPTNSSRTFSLTMTLHHYDDTSSQTVVDFNPDSHCWQFVSGAVVAKAAYHSASLRIQYGCNANTVWFDGMQVFKEQFGTSYTYDDEGNVESVTDLQNQTTEYEYDTNNNLTRILQDNKAKMTYTYDNYHNVITATSQEGLKYAFEYDTYGNNDSVSIINGSVEINAIAKYSDDGNYMTEYWDPLNRITKYKYDPDTGELDWSQHPEDLAQENSDDFWTNYTYDGLNRVTNITTYTDGLDPFVNYSYSGSRLSTIQTVGGTYRFGYGAFGLRTSVSIDGHGALATYNYNEETEDDRRNDLDSLDYGNGDSVQYTYDTKGRLIQSTYVDDNAAVSAETVIYAYDNSGNLASVTDSVTGITTTYYYDLIDRMMKYVEKGDGYSHSVGYAYDTLNNLTQQVETINGEEYTTSYTYDDDNRVISSSDGTVSEEYQYDTYGRLYTQETQHNGVWITRDTYTFENLSDRYTSTQISDHEIHTRNYQCTYSYEYDKNCNITKILKKHNGVTSVVATYSYDTLNQLIREDNPTENYTYTWQYDRVGNILYRQEYPYTAAGTAVSGTPVTYAYGYNTSGWEDKLISYGGKSMTYDQVGNLVSDNSWIYTWERGRQLKSIYNPGTTWCFTYNADGMRTKREHIAANGTTTTWKYIYNGGQLVQMTKGSETLHFTYDAKGAPQTVTHNGTLYYYLTNLQGDVIGLCDHSSSLIVSYTYDAWGNPLSTNCGSGYSTIAELNPLRYRGYIYDAETGLYYVSSRYYDPEIGRWINADNQLSTGSDLTGMNLFAYCGNNPVNRIDPTGEAWWHWALGAAVVAVAAVATVVTCGGFAAAATAVCMVGSGVAAATTASTVAAAAFIGSATVYGTAVLAAASSSNSIEEFNAQGNWGTIAATAGGAVFNGAAAYAATRTPTTTVYRSVSSAEAQDIKNTGQFNLAPGGMESKQFGFNLSETRQFGNKMGQNIVVSAKVPTNLLGQFYDGGPGGIDTTWFPGGTLTVYGDMLPAFNQAVRGTIKFLP